MNINLVSVISLLLSFLASIACLKYLFSKEIFIWIFPFCLGLYINYYNFNALFITKSDSAFIFSIIFFITIFIFRYALKKKSKDKKAIKKNYKEAMYLQKIEIKDYNKRLKDKELSSLYGFSAPDLKYNCDLSIYDK